MGFSQSFVSSAVLFFTPEECDVYSSAPFSNSALEEGRLVAINIALLRSGGSDMFCSRTDICKEL